MAKKEQAISVIPGVLHYCMVKNPGLAMDKKTRQWQVQIEITEDFADKIEEEYPDMRGSIKSYKADKFEEIFKVAPSVEPDAKKHFVISVKQACTINGKKFGYPVRVLMKGENGKLQDVTQKTEVGNGSKGVVQVREMESAKWKTTTLKLQAIRVDDLVEYESGSSLDELGEVDYDSFEDGNYGGSGEAPESAEGQGDDVPDFDDEENY